MGVSNNNAQENIQPKGNKKDFKKPLQVLHLSKKNTQKKISRNTE
jgi:small subunit ribosomal protein S1